MSADDNRAAIGNLHDGIVAGLERSNPVGINDSVIQLIVDMFVDVQHCFGH